MDLDLTTAAEDLAREAGWDFLEACFTGAPSGVIALKAAAFYQQQHELLKAKRRALTVVIPDHVALVPA